MLSNIKDFTRNIRQKARLIFKFDALNSTNFHRYIDGKWDILLVIKLDNGFVVGGYCHSPFEKGRIDKHDKGFLFSLIPEKVKYLPKR